MFSCYDLGGMSISATGVQAPMRYLLANYQSLLHVLCKTSEFSWIRFTFRALFSDQSAPACCPRNRYTPVTLHTRAFFATRGCFFVPAGWCAFTPRYPSPDNGWSAPHQTFHVHRFRILSCWMWPNDSVVQFSDV